ncbi:MAG: addiction module protein [Armatimonadetes bacterium]|nr:addiction module protein [Armatimonadota bacterium]
MDRMAVLREVDSWPVEERLRLMEAVWDSMVESGWEPELTDAQKTELDRRLADLEAQPDNVVSWEDVQAHVRRPR